MASETLAWAFRAKEKRALPLVIGFSASANPTQNAAFDGFTAGTNWAAASPLDAAPNPRQGKKNGGRISRRVAPESDRARKTVKLGKICLVPGNAGVKTPPIRYAVVHPREL
jgi:hypothetical protein